MTVWLLGSKYLSEIGNISEREREREREKNFLLSKTEKLMNHVINEIDQFDVRRSCYSSATLVQCGRNHITECQYSSHTDPVRYSVTKFCKGSPL